MRGYLGKEGDYRVNLDGSIIPLRNVEDNSYEMKFDFSP